MKLETRDSRLETDDVIRRAKLIKLLLMDCDGVLTDGRLELLENGDEQKTFHARDGLGISLFHRAGLCTGIISGRTSGAVERRAQDLRMSYLYQSAKNKTEALKEILQKAGVTADECAFIGDDVADIPAMLRVGLAVAVADAVAETRAIAHYITCANGGHGAVREVTDLILKAQGKWDELLKPYIELP
jgi:3-deoxy-D-manno-octulosonate 8-phosphate phosphatase (KDO 8-P phosphatase)